MWQIIINKIKTFFVFFFRKTQFFKLKNVFNYIKRIFIKLFISYYSVSVSFWQSIFKILYLCRIAMHLLQKLVYYLYITAGVTNIVFGEKCAQINCNIFNWNSQDVFCDGIIKWILFEQFCKNSCEMFTDHFSNCYTS